MEARGPSPLLPAHHAKTARAGDPGSSAEESALSLYGARDDVLLKEDGYSGNLSFLQPLLLRWRLFFCQNNVMPGLAFGNGIHGSHSDQILFFGVELNGRIADFGGYAGEPGFALSVGVNTHIKFVRAGESVCQMHVDEHGKYRLGGRVSHSELYGARPGRAIGDRNVF